MLAATLTRPGTITAADMTLTSREQTMPSILTSR
jgi:hypothetical protein